MLLFILKEFFEWFWFFKVIINYKRKFLWTKNVEFLSVKFSFEITKGNSCGLKMSNFCPGNFLLKIKNENSYGLKTLNFSALNFPFIKM